MLSAKDERHSLWATLWFNIAHFAIRPWPWILTALAALILYPNLEDKESGYVLVMIDHLPASLRGLMFAGFIAAYMSTIGTNLNWGASYIVNDFYRRFYKPDEPEKHYVWVSQWVTILLTIVSAIVTFYLTSIAGAWKVLLATGAGTGGVLMLRWYWWRINAWSEISAMLCAAVVSIVLQLVMGMDSDRPVDFAWIMIITVTITTVVWLSVTFLTKPEPMDKLVEFYRRVRPSKAGWGPVAKVAGPVETADDAGAGLVDWLLGCGLIYTSLFGTGKLILGEPVMGSGLLALAAAAAYLLYRRR
jgi:Na+/proline symporter